MVERPRFAAWSIPSAPAADASNAIVIDPKPRFELSPYLYMQFMEPLGTTDGSVAAAWDFGRDCWRQDLIDVTRRLAPTMMRWGGRRAGGSGRVGPLLQ